ncbi:hypothetical protein PIB30_051370 [Stylosanthes scabra]|uniref:Uncharacterized protein n=1 Tax=Stylosanthes scabra TaxID=79078 RepID=A0ABU6RHZ6_9FABA|nr:hypothetical protein [Stylosanthes scabra]
MAFNKATVFLLLLLVVYGASLLGSKMKGVDAKLCPEICYKAAYMTCPSSGDKHLTPKCNCCIASTGCTLYNSDGTTICTAT